MLPVPTQLQSQIRQAEAASCYSDAVSLSNWDRRMFMEQSPRQSFPPVRNVAKVYHPMIRLINGTAAEQTTWLKCKYPKCKWLNWITGNYKVSSWDPLPFCKWVFGRESVCLLEFEGHNYQTTCFAARMQAGNNRNSGAAGSCHRWQKSECTPSGLRCAVISSGSVPCFHPDESMRCKGSFVSPLHLQRQGPHVFTGAASLTLHLFLSLSPSSFHFFGKLSSVALIYLASTVLCCRARRFCLCRKVSEPAEFHLGSTIQTSAQVWQRPQVSNWLKNICGNCAKAKP